MDFFNIVYYGIICGILGVSAPALGNKAARLVVGIGIGVIGAALLPILKNLITG